MSSWSWIVLGVVLAAAFLVFATSRRNGRRVIAIGLLVAALIYVALAAIGGAGAAWLAIEAVGVIIFGLFAWLGCTRAVWWLAFGWAAHVVWDVALHRTGAGAAFTPGWYPLLCIGFDLAVAVVVVVLARTGPGAGAFNRARNAGG